MDESIIQKLCSFSAQDLANFLHCFRDSFIRENRFFVNLFLVRNKASCVFFCKIGILIKLFLRGF